MGISRIAKSGLARRFLRQPDRFGRVAQPGVATGGEHPGQAVGCLAQPRFDSQRFAVMGDGFGEASLLHAQGPDVVVRSREIVGYPPVVRVQSPRRFELLDGLLDVAVLEQRVREVAARSGAPRALGDDIGPER